jgi:thiol-disulfide isomerase/thioredoxin
MDVICLCAQWCQLCNAYRETFDAFATRHSTHQFAFIDIEDEADLLDLIGGIDIVDFPTLLIIDAADLRFFGPVTPQSETLERIVRAAGTGSLPPPQPLPGAGALQVLLQGIAERHLYLPAPVGKLPVP